MTKQLRDYQSQAVESILREFETAGSTLCVMPTGTGKTMVAADVIREILSKKEGGCIFLAHREELLNQAKTTIEAHCRIECEFELGNQKASEIFPADVLLASVQTMISGRNGTRRMHKFSPSNYNLIVVDEVHHGTAASYREVLEYLKSGNPEIKVLGITATPSRSDEEALSQICESVAFDYQILQAMKDGWLVPIQQQLIDIQSLDFSHVRTTAGDLNLGDLAAVMEEERNLFGVCDATMKEIGNRKAIMYAVRVRQAELACDILNNYRTGVAQWASGKTTKEDRRRIMRDFSEGRFQILVNCNLVEEGFDVPDADLLIDAAPTKSKLRYQQRLGRIMRPLTGVVDKENYTPTDRLQAIAGSDKPSATVIDFTGNAGRHKLIHAVDVLGGNISGRTRELAERELRRTGKPTRIDELVIEAEQLAAKERKVKEATRKSHITGRATYTSRIIDPFDAFDIVAPPNRIWNSTKSLSTRQRELLRKQGIDADALTYSEGKTILNEFFYRWKNNLCSLRQAACLKRFGYETKGMTHDQASQAITALKANGWRKEQ